MQYRWDEYAIDTQLSVLTRYGQPVDVSRRVFVCIVHLIENHARVVSRDELIRLLWRHDDVTNHQLAQIVLSARKAIGDNGHAQRQIRTVPGLGYQWVGVLKHEPALRLPAAVAPSDDAGLPLETDIDSVDPPERNPQVPLAMSNAVAVPPSMRSDGPGDESMPAERREEAPVQIASGARGIVESAGDSNLGDPSSPGPWAALSSWDVRIPLRATIGALAVTAVLIGLLASAGWLGMPSMQTAKKQDDPLVPLEAALQQGRFEDVREGLAKLPAAVADSPDAVLLAVRLDEERGRFQNASRKLDRLQGMSVVTNDPLLRARVMIERVGVNVHLESMDRDEVMRTAQGALDILSKMGRDAPPELIARALSARALVWIRYDDLAAAARDITRSRDLYLEAGRVDDAMRARSSLTRVWMRLGRLEDALAELAEVSRWMRREGRTVDEVYAVNRMTRIQMELMRWTDALASSDRAMALLREAPDLERRYRCLNLRAQVMTGLGRLREAQALIEEAEAIPHPEPEYFSAVLAMIEAREYDHAADAAARAFHSVQADDNGNILFESKDGALLLWVIAAQGKAGPGRPLPDLEPDMRARLENPATTLAYAARGRWRWSRGRLAEAEADLRLALSKAQTLHQYNRMRWIVEALVGVLLQRGDGVAAHAVVEDLRAYEPEAFDGDYRARVLAWRVALAIGDRIQARASRATATGLAGERGLPDPP